MIFLISWFLGLIAGVIGLINNPACKDAVSIAANFLYYQLVVSVTLSGLIGFAGHVFASDKIAGRIGWPQGSPFQKELGFAELGFGLSGILCAFFPAPFKAAVIVAISPLFLGAAVIHIHEMQNKGNFHPSNVSSILPDLLLPITLSALAVPAGIWSV